MGLVASNTIALRWWDYIVWLSATLSNVWKIFFSCFLLVSTYRAYAASASWYFSSFMRRFPSFFSFSAKIELWLELWIVSSKPAKSHLVPSSRDLSSRLWGRAGTGRSATRDHWHCRPQTVHHCRRCPDIELPLPVLLLGRIFAVFDVNLSVIWVFMEICNILLSSSAVDLRVWFDPSGTWWNCWRILSPTRSWWISESFSSADKKWKQGWNHRCVLYRV